MYTSLISCLAFQVLPNGEEAGLGIIPSKIRWERKQGKKNRRLVFHGSRSSTSLDRSMGNINRRSKGQKIAFSRKFPFMKSRERLNKLEDDELNGDDDTESRLNTRYEYDGKGESENRSAIGFRI